jgi:formylglycine-generating enzyme required for sulfatase activity
MKCGAAKPRRWGQALVALGLLTGGLYCGTDKADKAASPAPTEMVLIPAGEFEMGGKPEDLTNRPGRSDYLNYLGERPLHKVRLSAFYLDRFEATNAQYRRFLAETAATRDRVDHPDQPAGLGHEQAYVDASLSGDTQPAVGLNWFDAYAYCRWQGKRLPTEAEWEYAARGNDGLYRKYPWGNDEPDAGGTWRANLGGDDSRGRDGYEFSAPVGSFPAGASPFGIQDLSGNATEWVNDWLDWNYYANTAGASDPQGPPSGKHKVLKGGSYSADRYNTRIATRLWGEREVKNPYQGVRCARTP